MKKTVLLLSLSLLIITTTKAQISIPNGGFENWASAIFDNPANYVQTSNFQSFTYFGSAFNCERVPVAFHGNYAIKITTVLGTVDTSMGYFLNGNPNGPPSNWQGGIPYNQQATGISGHYQSAIPPGDTAHLIVDFKLGGTSIGVYFFNFWGTHSSYVPFHFDFFPALAVAPDSIIFGAASSDFMHSVNLPGSMLQLDSINFTGVSSQPALLNGDFETWVSDTLNSLNNWYQNGGGGNGNNSVLRTTDAYNGNYALELITVPGQNNSGVPRAQPGGESTGYYVCQGGSGPCYPEGGYPFINQVDTLCFYYKYAPATASDTAGVGITFKYNGSQTFGSGAWLLASPGWQYYEIPFNTWGPVDTLIVGFQSTLWQDSAVTAIGSVLKVDDVHLKSQNPLLSVAHIMSTDGVTIAPNPFSSLTTITFAEEQKNTTLKVVDVLGNVVQQTTISNRQYTLDMTAFAKGMYFVQYTDASGKAVNRKIIKE